MKFDTLKLVAGKVIPVVPVLIGALLGIGGTKAMDSMAPTAQTLIEVKCVVPKPDPIKVEFIRK